MPEAEGPATLRFYPTDRDGRRVAEETFPVKVVPSAALGAIRGLPRDKLIC